MKKIIIVAVVFLLAIAGAASYYLQTYSDYTEKSQLDRGDDTETTYQAFQGNLLKYSRDGAFYMKFNGDLIWNYTYEMDNPQCDICEGYLIIYDKGGNQAAVLNSAGYLNSVKTTYPIVAACVANQGTMAILTQDGTTGYMQLYSTSGDILVSGQLHMENNGYPVAVDLSAEGTRLVVAQLDLNSGDVKTSIVFYDFGDAGQDEVDNQLALYSFSNQVFAELHFLKNGSVVAFGDEEIVLFDSSSTEISKEIFYQGDARSVFYSDKQFGYIYSTYDEEGNYVNQLLVYNQSGKQKVSCTVDSSFTQATIISNREIVLNNGSDVEVYTMYGVRKFSYTFDSVVVELLTGDTPWRYYLVTDQTITNIALK